MSYFEKDAIISGLGISRIGRRTGIPGLELTHGGGARGDRRTPA